MQTITVGAASNSDAAPLCYPAEIRRGARWVSPRQFLGLAQVQGRHRPAHLRHHEAPLPAQPALGARRRRQGQRQAHARLRGVHQVRQGHQGLIRTSGSHAGTARRFRPHGTAALFLPKFFPHRFVDLWYNMRAPTKWLWRCRGQPRRSLQSAGRQPCQSAGPSPQAQDQTPASRASRRRAGAAGSQPGLQDVRNSV